MDTHSHIRLAGSGGWRAAWVVGRGPLPAEDASGYRIAHCDVRFAMCDLRERLASSDTGTGISGSVRMPVDARVPTPIQSSPVQFSVGVSGP